jgi:REP element-mobilizing transposase RayT
MRQWKEEKKTWMRRNPEPWSDSQQNEYNQRFPYRIEKWLDAGEGKRLLATKKVNEIVSSALLYFDGARYVLDEFIAMPNHVHVLFSPKKGHTPSDVLHGWKSFSAHEINKKLGQHGSVWMDENFDHIVRSVEQLEHFRSYIRKNPGKARIADSQFYLGRGMGLRPANGSED